MKQQTACQVSKITLYTVYETTVLPVLSYLYTFCDERENIRTECGGECFIQKHMSM